MNKKIYNTFLEGHCSFLELVEKLIENNEFLTFFSSDRRSVAYKSFKKSLENTQNLRDLYTVLLEQSRSPHLNSEVLLRHFFSHTELLNELLMKNICSFKDIIDLFKSSQMLSVMTGSQESWKKLSSLTLISSSDLQYLLEKLTNEYATGSLVNNPYLFRRLFVEVFSTTPAKFQVLLDQLSDEKIVDALLTNSILKDHLCVLTDSTENLKKFVDILFQDRNDNSLRNFLNFALLNSSKIFDAAVKHGVIGNDELQNLFEKSRKSAYIENAVNYSKAFMLSFIRQTSTTSDTIRSYFNALTVSQAVASVFNISEFKSDKMSDELMKEFFVTQNEILRSSDIERLNEVFCADQPLYLKNLKCTNILEGALKRNIVWSGDKKKDLELHQLQLKIHRNKEMYELGILNFNHFSTEQLYEVYDCIQNSERAKNNLKMIVDNSLESTYLEFETLMSVLDKDDKKKRYKLNL